MMVRRGAVDQRLFHLPVPPGRQTPDPVQRAIGKDSGTPVGFLRRADFPAFDRHFRKRRAAATQQPAPAPAQVGGVGQHGWRTIPMIRS